MANQVNPNLTRGRQPAKTIITAQEELERIRVERGWLGQFWGSSASIPNNIAALTITFLLLTGLSYSCIAPFFPKEKLPIPVGDLWTTLSPLLTLVLGYIFGDKVGKKNIEN